MPAQDPTLDHTGAPPDSKLFGIPRYQPFIGGKSFDYEQKYSPDPQGKEASPEARVWATYLDEAEMYDHDMIQGFRDTIDSLLVLAGLFSAIVATFVAQTSQSLRPDFAQLNLLVQIEQTALLRTGGNVTAMNNIPPSNITTGTSTYTTADLWINGLFFTSLSLAIATALLAVLVKQWCQAYTSVTSGSAKDKVLTRQFRFDGLMKWKLPEIVGSLPLLLHLAFAVFFAGLSYFVYDLHKSLSSIVISSAVLAEFLYFGSILLPAVWLECPYRIPLLFRPARSFIYVLAKLYSLIGSPSFFIFPVLHRYLPPGKPRIEDVLVSLKESEKVLLSIPHTHDAHDLSQPMLILAHSLVWLFKLSNNVATQRIVTATLYGCLVEYWNLPLNNLTWRLRMLVGIPSLITFLKATLQSSMVKIAFEILIDQVHERVPHDDHTKSSPGVWIGVLDVVFHCSKIPSGALPTPITRDELNRELSILMYAGMRQVDLKDPLLRWGADINYCGHNGDGFLHDAIRANNLDTVQFLIDHHCQIDEPVAKYNGSPLMSACDWGFLDAVRLLVTNGANVNQVMEGASFRGGACTPLTISIASKWNPDIVTFLLENGAHINETFPLEGRTSTPLQFAAEIGKPEAVSFLLEKGAVLSSKIKDTIHRLDWIGSSNPRTTRVYISEIERMLLEHASRVIEPRCLPTGQLGPVLSRELLR